MRTLLLTILFTLCFLISLGEANAAKRYTWDGSSDSSWTVAANWTAGGGANANGTTAAPFIIDGTYGSSPVAYSTPLGFNMQDCRINGGSIVRVKGGDLDFNGDVALYGGSDLIITGGSVNITGSLYLYDNNTDIILNGGDLIVTGDIIFGNNGTEPDGPNGATSISLVDGGITARNIIFDDLTGDTHTLNISSGLIALSRDIRSDGADVVINMSGTADISLDDLTMIGGSDMISMSDNSLIRIRGNWENSGSSSLSGNSAVRFEGGKSRTISNANGSEAFNILRVNSTGSTALSDSIIIKTRLEIFNGIISCNGNSVTFNDGAIVNGAASSRYIDGPVNKIGNNNFDFPIGNGIYYFPIGIEFSGPALPTDMFRAEYTRSNPEPLYSFVGRTPSISAVSTSQYWMLNRKLGISTPSVKLSWNSDNGSSGVTDPSTLTVIKWDTNGVDRWIDLGNGGVTGNATAGTIISHPDSTFTDFSPFTLGTTSAANPLPVDLLDFSLQSAGNHALINWTTATETNNDYFKIEKTFDGKNVFEIARIESKAQNGNSLNRLDYNYRDLIDFNGSAYYRLVQVDFNGDTREYPFEAISVELQQSNKTTKKVSVFPNPLIDEGSFKVSVKTENPESIQFRLYKLSGQVVNIKTQRLSQNIFEIRIPDSIDKGIYFLNIIDPNSDSSISTEKIIVQ